LTTVANAQAAIKQFTNIPAQGLGAALQTLAKERRLSVVYVSEEIDARQTEGAVGEFTADEALTKLLQGSGLTDRYVNDQTVTIVPLATTSLKSQPSQGTAPEKKETQRKTGFWDRFRMAQAEQSAPSAASSAAEDPSVNPGTLEQVVVTAQKREERL